MIIPVGLHYEEKFGLRGRIFVRVGDPIHLDKDIAMFVDEGQSEDDSNREAVRKLTAEIETRLRAAAPDYASVEEWTVFAAAAEVTIRADMYDPSGSRSSATG